jgi:hypothetical protein
LLELAAVNAKIKNDKSSFRADYHQKSSGKRSNSSHSRPTALVDG